VDSIELKPARRAAGTVRLPGSKSISNRVLLLAALARGDTEIAGLLDADDTRVMREALLALGVATKGNIVQGVGGPFPSKKAELFLGNAGTALRPLTAALAFTGGDYLLWGAPRMHERPIGDLVDALRGIGARIDYQVREGFPPLLVHPSKLELQNLRVRGDVSSQFLTSLLMALPLSGKAARVEVQGELISKPYVEITLNVMRLFGVNVRRGGGWRWFEVPAASYVSPGKVFVEGDASSASYFLAAGAIGGGPVRVEGVGRNSIQGDVRFTEVLERMGAQVSVLENAIEVENQNTRLKPVDMDMNHIPDAAMTAAVLALFADGTSAIRNIASWRVKETDRLAAMAAELRKVGAQVEEGTDFLKIAPPSSLKGDVSIDTYDDHRMAMSFSLISLAGVPVRINDPQCVAKTFPDYFSVYRSITS
jgi:3-phosphoshikimate 1-carboxyvinyltransferase